MKIQLSKQFSVREKILLSILGILIVAAVYLLLVHQPVAEETARIEGEMGNAESTMMVLQARTAVLDLMQEQVEQAQSDPNAPQVADYDNLQSVMRQLNTALAGAAAYDLRFDAVAKSEDGGPIVRRVIRMGFTCESYQQARGVIDRLAGGPFRCQISDLRINLNDRTRGDGAGKVSVELMITYFERLP